MLDVHCWCEPDVLDEHPDGTPLRQLVVKHHAADGREACENFLGCLLADDKYWTLVLGFADAERH